MEMPKDLGRPNDDEYLYTKKSAWFAFAMTVALMIFDYIDRQVIVSLFPHIKKEWGLSDKELGSLVSIVSITVAVCGIPIALIADRYSRVKSIVYMAVFWGLATISCMFTKNYSQLFLARAAIGVGEAGYGSVGAALLSTHFPSKMRSTIMAAFFASASIGSVLGVLLGGVIAAKYGWQAAFGIVGFPGLLLALLYYKVRDYTNLNTTIEQAPLWTSVKEMFKAMFSTFKQSKTLQFVCIAAPLQLITLSSIWSWMPSFLNRTYGMAPQAAGMKAALIVLIGALGGIITAFIIDRAGRNNLRSKFTAIAVFCLFTAFCIFFAFGSKILGFTLTPEAQFNWILAGGFFMTCSVGPAAAIVMDILNPSIRSTGASVLSLVQNLLGLAIGPFLSGMLSDAYGLVNALTIIPIASVFAAIVFILAGKTYASDVAKAKASLA